MDDVRGHLDGVGRLYEQVDEKIAEKGGLGNLFGMNSKLRDSMAGISSGDIDLLLNEIQRAKESLGRLEQELIGFKKVLNELNATFKLLPEPDATPG